MRESQSNFTVLKLGGSVLKGWGDAAAILEILAGYRGPLIVVVSALKGVTDALKEAASRAAQGEGGIGVGLVPVIRDRYAELARSFGAPPAAEAAALLRIEELLCALGRALFALAEGPGGEIRNSCIPAARGFITNRILAIGERLSAVCIALAMTALGRPTPVIEPGRLGIVVVPNGNGGATADIAASTPRIKASLAGRDAAVVPGFYGIGADGEPYLFGRGGSDYSAAVVAACLGAARCDFIKDVAGLFTADPDLVPEARPVLELSYDEADALALGGAGILHSGCIEPLREARVPLRVLGGPSHRGQTSIGPVDRGVLPGPRALALAQGPFGSDAITVAGGGASSKAAAQVLRALEARGLQARAFSPGAGGSSFRLLVQAGSGGEALRVAHDALFA